MLREDGSYPSGHNAIGWASALILAEIAPERADLVLARGRAFGQSRVICNVHWQSDASEGRTMGAAAVARMIDEMRWIPVSLRLAIFELAATLVPMTPLLLFKYPIAELADKLVGRLVGG